MHYVSEGQGRSQKFAKGDKTGVWGRSPQKLEIYTECITKKISKDRVRLLIFFAYFLYYAFSTTQKTNTVLLQTQ